MTHYIDEAARIPDFGRVWASLALEPNPRITFWEVPVDIAQLESNLQAMKEATDEFEYTDIEREEQERTRQRILERIAELRGSAATDRDEAPADQVD